MKTHTLRARNDGIKIIKFTPSFFKRLKNSNWWSVGLAINHLKSQIENLTGITSVFDLDQKFELNEYFGFPKSSNFNGEKFAIERWVVKGIECESRNCSLDVLDLLETTERFFNMYLDVK